MSIYENILINPHSFANILDFFLWGYISSGLIRLYIPIILPV